MENPTVFDHNYKQQDLTRLSTFLQPCYQQFSQSLKIIFKMDVKRSTFNMYNNDLITTIKTSISRAVLLQFGPKPLTNRVRLRILVPANSSGFESLV